MGGDIPSTDVMGRVRRMPALWTGRAKPWLGALGALHWAGRCWGTGAGEQGHDGGSRGPAKLGCLRRSRSPVWVVGGSQREPRSEQRRALGLGLHIPMGLGLPLPIPGDLQSDGVARLSGAPSLTGFCLLSLRCLSSCAVLALCTPKQRPPAPAPILSQQARPFLHLAAPLLGNKRMEYSEARVVG